MEKNSIIFVLGCIVGLIFSTGCATPFEQQLKSAKAGNAFAQYHVAMVYGTGTGGTLGGDIPVEKDIDKAVYWLEKSHRAGNGKATLALGLCYYYHLGVIRDYDNYENAFKLFKQAEEKGITDVYLWLGECYLKGRGVDQDENIAVDYFKKGSDQANETAKYCMAEIGSCYLYGYGVGVMRNYPECRRWFELAADNGNEQAKKFVDGVLTQDFYNMFDPNRSNDSTQSYKITSFETLKDGGVKFVAENIIGDTMKVVDLIKKDIIAGCENDLMFKDSSISRKDICWESKVDFKDGKVSGIVKWYYVRLISYDYNPTTRIGHLNIDTANKGYGEVKDYIMSNIKEICSTKLVAIKDGVVPEGSVFEIGKETQNPDGSLTVEFRAIN